MSDTDTKEVIVPKVPSVIRRIDTGMLFQGFYFDQGRADKRRLRWSMNSPMVYADAEIAQAVANEMMNDGGLATEVLPTDAVDMGS